MAGYSIYEMEASLCVQDTPIYYNPAYGPPLHFTVSYSQREMNQPSAFAYSNMGPLWTFNFLTYITDDPQSTTSNVTQYLSGGGTLTYTYDSNINGFDPQPSNMGQLTRLSSSSYELVLSDGSKQFFSTPGPGTTSRNVFLTSTQDPYGNTLTFNYDTTYRLTSIQDAAQHAMTINYGSNSQSNSGYYLITGVQSYDGRTASFTYDAAGNLASSTDMSGMTSSFYYTNGVMSSMVTPYGTTTFSTGQDGLTRWVQATDPQGGTERVETWGGITPLFQLTSPPAQPPGCDTQYLSDRNTFHWSKEAWAEAPHDYNAAEIIHWLQFTSNASAMSDVVESFKPANESRVCYEYPNQPTAQGQTVTLALGSSNQPSETLRLLDNGTTQQTNTTYNAQGNLLQEEDADGRYTTYVYAANGIDVTDVYQGQNSSGDHIGHYTYYPNTHEIETYTNAAGQSETFTYTGRGQLASVLDVNNNTVTYNYDTNGYLKSMVGPTINGGALSVSFTRDSYNRIGSITDVNSYTRQFAYDLLDRRTLITYPDGTTDENVYKNMDLFQHKDRQGHWTNYFYNAADQLVAKVDANNHYTNYNRCICGALLGIQDPDGNWTKVARDAEGRVLTKTYADGSLYSYTYNGVGQVSTVVDPKGQTTTYGYTTSGLLASESYSGGSISTPSLNYTYDTIYPRVDKMVDGIGTTQYTYYPAGSIGAGSVETETNPLTSAALTYSYDKKNRFTGVSISDGYSSSIAFDGADRLSSAQNQLGTFTYSYYAGTPRLQSITNSQNSLSTSFSYQTGSTQDFRLTDITNNANANTILSKFDYTYTPDGDLLSWQEQSGGNTATSWNYNYDNSDQLLNATKSNTQTQAVVAQYGYGYDPAGNRQTDQNGFGVTSTSFNNLNESASTSSGGNLIVAGTINKPGSVTVNGAAATVTGTYTFKATTPVTAGTNTLTVVANNVNNYASTNQYAVTVPSTPTTNPLYDQDGNLVNNGNGQTYEWDAKNELVGINYANGNSTSFSYDGVGRRVQIVEKANGTVTATRNFIWVGNTPAEEHNAAGTVTKRYYGQGEQITGTNYYYTRDHLGSVREMTDGSGNVQARYQYDPYGVASTVGTLLIGSDVQYAGYFFHAASALLLTLYRAYDCNSARWLSRDPSGERGGSFSLYAFNTNNALRFVDSLGLCPKECQGLQDTYDAAMAKVNRDQETVNEDNEQIFIDQGRIAIDLVFLGLSAAALYIGAVKARGIIGAIEIIAGLIGLGAFGIALALDSRQLANDQRKLATDTANMAADAQEAMADYTALEQCDLKYSGPPFIGPLPPIPSS